MFINQVFYHSSFFHIPKISNIPSNFIYVIMSMVSLELLFPIMESVDRGANTGVTETEESYHCTFQGLFLWWKHKFLFISRMSYGRSFDHMKFYTNHILQSYLKQLTCRTCFTSKRNVISSDNTYSKYACSKSAILMNQLSRETTRNFLKNYVRELLSKD